MILKFIFKTSSTQGIIEKISLRVAKEVGAEIGLSRDLDKIYVYVKNNFEEFSKRLSTQLPISIFLESVEAEVVDEFRDDLKRDFPSISLPPCPKCLEEVKNPDSPYYYDIFHHCEVCGYKAEGKKTSKELFENLASKIKDKIKIQTMNGAFEVGVDFKDADVVVARDLAAIGKYFFSFKNDAKALASIEKPMMKMKTNLEFKKKFGPYNAFWVKLPDCMVLELLFDSSDLELLALKRIDKPVDLVFDVKIQKPLKAVVSESDVLVYDGDRGLLPKFEKFVKEGIIGKHKKYVAFSKDDKTIIKRGDLKNTIEAKEVYAGFYGVLSQWELEDKNVLGFSFYKDDNKIFLYSKKFGLVEYLDFKFGFDDFEEIFALIARMNESGKKLVENFVNKRASLFNHAISCDISSKSKGIYYLWGLVGILLGLGDDVESGVRELLKRANEAMTKKGPRIDYKFDGNNLNPLWTIRTAMSFNLAGVDEYLLSYGVVESFAEFLSNIYEEANKDNNLDGAIIVGDMFEGEFFAKIYSYIKKNYPTFIPKALPSSGAIEAYGSLVIASKGD